MACLFRSRLNGRAAGEDDQVGKRDLLAACLGFVEPGLDCFKLRKHLGQFGGLVHFPVLLRSEADARAVGAAALVTAAEAVSRGPCCADQLGNRQTRCEDFCLEGFCVLVIDEFVIDGGNGVLPDEDFLWDERAEVACDGAHVAVGKLEPRAREGICKLVGMREEAARDLLIRRIKAQREVGGEHRRCVMLLGVVGVRDESGACVALGLPLMGACGTPGQLPLKAEEILEEVVAPFGGGCGPGDFKAGADGVSA